MRFYSDLHGSEWKERDLRRTEGLVDVRGSEVKIDRLVGDHAKAAVTTIELPQGTQPRFAE